LTVTDARAAGGGQRDGDCDAVVSVDIDALDHAEVDDVVAEFGVDDSS